ncbi:Hypothetical predicted protein [Lecanosticta acicola]|uniref:GPI anchored protein n=1 Tax=Lecanosticta acicola TaxID=111012 RepID=A0AAI8YVG2_9PEZI|nr:Hypothetical predicted protein [Lecanosticta acicola]
MWSKLTFFTLASLASAQVVSQTTSNGNPVQVTGTSSSVTLPLSLPTSFISTLSNHIPGTASTGVGCTTITMQGQPVFTIQTDTSTQSGCTYTVFAGSGSATSNTSIVFPTFSSLPVPVAPGPVIIANSTMNGTSGVASSTGGRTTTSSGGAVVGGGGSTSTAASGTSSGAGGASSTSTRASTSAQSSGPANANAPLTGEGLGLAVVAGIFMML